MTWRLRSFTPIGAEVFGAGHNAMGAWLWLTSAGRPGRHATEFVQEIGEDVLPVVVGRDAVDRAVPEAARLAGVLRRVGGEGCYVYSSDPVDVSAVAYTRFFTPTVGIQEDPATGTAAGPLVARLVVAGQVADGVTAVVEQGYALGPSRIYVTVAARRVRVSGSGLVVAQGTLRV